MRTYTRTASSTRLSPAFAGVTRQVLSGGPRASGCYKDASLLTCPAQSVLGTLLWRPAWRRCSQTFVGAEHRNVAPSFPVWLEGQAQI